MTSNADLKKLDQDFAELEAEALDRLIEDRVPEDRRMIQRVADCRYKGQGYELRVSVPDGEVTDETISTIISHFHEAHEKEFGKAFMDNDIEIVNIRAVGIGKIPELKWPKLEKGPKNPAPAYKYEKDVIFEVDGQPRALRTKVYEHSLLKSGNVLVGPTIVEQMDSTVVINPGHEGVVDDFGNIMISM